MQQVQRNPVITVTVAAQDAGRRIDNYLMSKLKDVPRARIYRMLRNGEVRLNGGRARPDRRVAEADQIRIPPCYTNAKQQPVHVPAQTLQSLTALTVFEDDYLLVIDKPAGIAVHSGSGLRWGIIDALRRARPNAPYLELAHRLDRDTSGCLVIAKDTATLRYLHAQLRTKQMEKTYFALVEGHWPRTLRQINAPLSRDRTGATESRVRISPAGKDAVTRIIETRRIADATLVRFQTVTGRTHQLRVHSANAGHPLAGDRKYGDTEFNKRLKAIGLKRMFLHADSIRLKTAEHCPAVEVTAPLPDDLQAILEILDRDEH